MVQLYAEIRLLVFPLINRKLYEKEHKLSSIISIFQHYKTSQQLNIFGLNHKPGSGLPSLDPGQGYRLCIVSTNCKLYLKNWPVNL